MKLFRRGSPAETKPEEIRSTVTPAMEKKAAMEYHLANLQGIGTREAQEDAFAFGNALDPEAIEKGGLLAVVADGMGGMADGRTASATVTETLLQDFAHFDAKADLAGQLESAVHHAGDAVWRKLREQGGSTVVAGLIFQEKLYFTSVGDSSLYLLRDTRLIHLNRSQNVLNNERLRAIREGHLDPQAGQLEPDRDAITQFVGLAELEETDSLRRPLALLPGDVLLFCTDGVAGVLDETILRNCLLDAQPEAMCRSIEEKIRTAGRKYQDNYTALIIQCRK